MNSYKMQIGDKIFLLCLLPTFFSPFLLSLLCLRSSFLCIISKSSEIDANHRFISYNPCIMTRWNYGCISWSKFFLTAIIHYNLNAPRYHVLCMGSFTTVCFYDRFNTFIPTPSWFKRHSPDSSAVFKCG